jgi:hypothetical protein
VGLSPRRAEPTSQSVAPVNSRPTPRYDAWTSFFKYYGCDNCEPHDSRVWYRVRGPEIAPQIAALPTRPKRIRSATSRSSGAACYQEEDATFMAVQDRPRRGGWVLIHSVSRFTRKHDMEP